MIQTSKAFYLLFVLLLLKGMQINIKHIYFNPNQQLLAINKLNAFDDWTTIRHRWYWNRLNVDMQDWSEFGYRIQPSVQYYAFYSVHDLISDCWTEVLFACHSVHFICWLVEVKCQSYTKSTRAYTVHSIKYAYDFVVLCAVVVLPIVQHSFDFLHIL